MKKIIKNLLNFFQSKNGDNSSKRLAFISSFIIVYYEYHNLMAELIKAGVYDKVVDVFSYGGIAMLIIGGFVTAEFFGKNGK